MDLMEEIKLLSRLNKRRSLFSLSGLIIVFFCSLSLFFYAELLIPSSDSEKQIIEMSVKQDKLRVQIRELEIELKNALEKYNYYKVYRDEAVEMKKQISEEDKKILISRGERAEKLEGHLIEQRKSYEENEKNLKDKLEREATKPTTIDDIISVAITRVGAVMLSVFMMQILLTFYKYFMRLTNFYESKIIVARAFTSATSAEEIQRTLSIDHIVFGKEPQIPIEKILELVKLSK